MEKMKMELIKRQDAIDVVGKSHRYEADRMTALQKLPTVTEQEIRNKAIEEFAEAICVNASADSLKVMLPDGFRADVVTIDFVNEMVIKIAESMKGEKE